MQFQKQTGDASSRIAHTVERARAMEKEAAELRLARIANGADPKHKNGKTLLAEYLPGGDH